MRNKVLKKYTTIPGHLYVNRSADSQLKAIIEEMQRPGYVLVARQMGKTNLLFHAKRTLENERRLFVYVDLSNPYNNERDCYRNIINSVIEPRLDLFSVIEHEILSIRNLNLPPHNEYSRCLRKVLDLFKGDLVIILDEIDALKSVSYSDNIFAQIRSNYFSRTNFPDFERLTYVLSGVIEPTELIKDKNKSPFNIGEKIYLDDFTKTEHEEFIYKSRLIIENQVSDEIFNWTNGNPRLTFDICSDVEDFIISGISVTKELISDIIYKKYLVLFDVAPIDHIREIVKSNFEIRNAIKSIHLREVDVISDDTKKKLYLYGIIDSRFNEPTYIKNRIIELSLSEDWIRSIDKTAMSLSYALEEFNNRNFDTALEAFQLYYESNLNSPTSVEISNYYLGLCNYHLQKFEIAINYFSLDFNSSDYKDSSKSFLGICKLATGSIVEGINILESIVSEGIQVGEFAYHNSLLNIAIHLDASQSTRAISLLEVLYNSTFNSDLVSSLEDLNELRTMSLYYQGKILLGTGLKAKAQDKIVEALNYATIPTSLFLYYFLDKHGIQIGIDLRIKLVDTIIDNNLVPLNFISNPLSFSESNLLLYIGELFSDSSLALGEKLLDYSDKNIFNGVKSKYELLYDSANKVPSNRSVIFEYLLSKEKEIDIYVLTRVYKDMLYLNINNVKVFLQYVPRFLELKSKSDFIESNNDLYLFTLIVKIYSENNLFAEALSLCKNLEDQYLYITDSDLKFEYIIIFYWYSRVYSRMKNTERAIFYANYTLSIISNAQNKITSFIDEAGLKSITSQMNDVKNNSNFNTPYVREGKRYGPNEKVKVKYTDGSVLEIKFKKVESDIKDRKCVIINE